MKKYIILFALSILTSTVLKSQNIEISYGTIIGLNTSFINVDSDVSIYYPFNEQDRNFNFDNSSKSKVGYDIGILFTINPVKNRFNLETGIILSKYNNDYTITLKYDSYSYISSVDTWMSETIEETVHNDFSVVRIPVLIGYSVYESEKFTMDILSGLTASINMDENHTKVDLNMEENQLYKDYFTSYQIGLRAYFNKIICQIKYERSFDIQEASSRDYFEWQMDVDHIYLNSVSLSFGYLFN